VDPDPIGSRDFLPNTGLVNGKALSKFVAVFSTTEHSHKEAWEHQQDRCGEENVVNKANRTNHFLAR
jgi:hypothetical protein